MTSAKFAFLEFLLLAETLKYFDESILVFLISSKLGLCASRFGEFELEIVRRVIFEGLSHNHTFEHRLDLLTDVLRRLTLALPNSVWARSLQSVGFPSQPI